MLREQTDKNLFNVTKAQIMMVDDDAITMDVVQTFLEEAGYERFELLEDPLKAITLMEEIKPDILLLDLVMPEISGFDVLAEVRINPSLKHIPVIILTGASDHESKLKALDLGASDFLAKPVDPSELVLRVRNTLSAKAYQDQLTFYDPATKLPNRRLFADRLDFAIKRAMRYGYKLALLSLSIDKFSELNAKAGAAKADAVLLQLVQRIESIIRSVDMVGLMAGVGEDEDAGLFRVEGGVLSLLLDRIEEVENAALIAERLVTSLREPYAVEGLDLFVSVSIGVATFPEEAVESKMLIELAASARAHASEEGGDGYKFSTQNIRELFEKRLLMENCLRKALPNDELVLFYQPKLDVSTGKIIGSEALVRWDGELGFISPDQFIPLAEETGLIIPMGKWILRTAFMQLAKWHKDGWTHLTMNVNLSLKQFNDPHLVSTVEKLIDEANISAKFFTLEITESLLMADIEETIIKLHKFRSLGFKVSIDDFGTGYSSFSYLSRLPVDELKIDRAFIMNLPDDDSSAAIVKSMIYLSHHLKLKTVAEGIETEEQLKFLQEAQCDTYQGFWFSKPLPNDEFDKLLTSSE